MRAVANGRAMRERNPHTNGWGGWLGTTGMRDWRGAFQKILGEVVRVANGKPVPTRERTQLRLKASTCGVGICLKDGETGRLSGLLVAVLD